MPAESTELQQFHSYLTRWIESEGPDQSLFNVIEEFRLYQQELERFNEKMQQAADDIERGDVGPLDLEALKAEIRSVATKQGAG